MNNKTKIHKIYGFIIKIFVIAIALLFIGRRLFSMDNMLGSFANYFQQVSFIRIFILVAILMLFNWSIEAIKWKYLIRKIESISFIKSIIAVLSGITVSIFTPNRIGEYAGRVFILEKADRWEGVLITMLGSMSQLLVTMLAGFVSFIFFANEHISFPGHHRYYFYGLAILIIILVIVLLFLFFNVSFLTKLIYKLPKRLEKIRLYGKIFSLYNRRELLKVLLLSLARYIVFFIQFYLLLNLFGAGIPLKQALVMIPMIYFVMTSIPTIAITELVVRGSVALYFMGLYFQIHNPSVSHDLGVLSASSFLWIINLAIPALVGAVFVFRLKIFRKS